MTQQDLSDDIAYIKSIAEEGRRAPLIGGRIGLWWGILLCVALLAHWAVLVGHIGGGPKMFGLIWSAFGLIGGIGSVILSRTLDGQSGSGSVGNTVSRAVWAASTVVLLLYGFAAGIASGIGHVPPIVADTILPAAFGIYAINYYTTGKMTGGQGLSLPSIVSCLLVPVSMILLGTAELYLLAAVGVLLIVVLPSLRGMRHTGA